MPTQQLESIFATVSVPKPTLKAKMKHDSKAKSKYPPKAEAKGKPRPEPKSATLELV